MTEPNIKKTEAWERDINENNNDLLVDYKIKPVVELHDKKCKKEQSSSLNLIQESRRKTPATRLRACDTAFIFEPPFFQLLAPPSDGVRRGYLISARCLSCNDNIRGVKNVNSNFVRHLKRVHPSVFIEYQTIKTNRLKARKMKHDEKISTDIEGDNSFSQDNNSPSDDALPIETEQIVTVASIKLKNNLNHHHQLLDNISSMAENEHNHQQEIEEENIEKRSKIEHLNTEHRPTDNQNAKISQMEKDLRIMEKRWHEVQLTVEEWRLNRRQMQREIDEIDQKQRQNNIIISNFKLNDDRINLTQSIEKFLNEELSLPDIKIKNVVIISKTNSIENKKTLKVELKNADANSVIIAANKLKNIETSVEPDLSTFASKRRNKLIVLSKEILRRNEMLNVIVCGTQMIIDGVHYFYWDDLDGLCDLENSADPIGKLNDIAGDTDYNEFIAFLKHFDVKIP